MNLSVGSRIEDYEILGVLGAGGMGQVYKVRNVISDRVEAMKVLLPDLASQQELAARFLREIKLLASLNHPHIAALHTALRTENQLLMVMEFVEGTSLDQRLQAGRIPLPECIQYMDQVLSALGYAHRQGIVHRDIKPSNMMLTSQGSIKLMDFGIARAAKETQLTRTGATLGSLHYMSPEQLTGDPTDARSDLYSLGVSFYEMVTGRRPFEAASDYSLMVAKVQQPPRPPVEVDPTIPRGLNDLIIMSLAKNPAERFQTADAFRGAVRATAESLNIALPAQGSTVVPSSSAGAEAHHATAARASSHRSLYMALGALIAIAIIVAGAVELPRWFKARAGAPAPGVASASSPKLQPPSSPQNSTASATSAFPPSSAAVPSSSPRSTAPSNSSKTPNAMPAGSVRHIQPTPPPNSNKQPATVPEVDQEGGSQSTAAQTSSTAPTPPAPAASSASQAKALAAAQDRMDMLAGRANAVKTSIQNLQQQEADAGTSLRPDILAAETRMERYMDEADSALNAHDAASARHDQKLAEREIDKLEKFLGQ
jgi:eukaryotic-like serine/threonine-protein kinase